MDASRFDALTRTLTAAGSRRRVVVTVLAGSLGVLGRAHPDDVEAAKSGKCKPACGECQRCDKGSCKRKNGKKRCARGKCEAKANGTACSGGSCQGGLCTAFCAGKNSCVQGNAPTGCQAGGPDECLCTVTDTGAPFCALIATVTVSGCPANPCPAGETCINVTGGDCPGGTQCARPCPNPL